MVAGPVDARATRVEVPVEDRPAAAATQRVAEGPEQFLPPRMRAVGLHQRLLRRRPDTMPVAAQVLEIHLVQDHRVRELELGRLQARDGKAGRIGRDLRQRLLDLVQVLDRAGVVLVVMRDDQFFRYPRQLLGIERQRPGRVLAEERVATRGRGDPAALARRLCDGRATEDQTAHQDFPSSRHGFRFRSPRAAMPRGAGDEEVVGHSAASERPKANPMLANHLLISSSV